MSVPSSLYIGLMSGTSLDGVDAVLALIGEDGSRVLGSTFLEFPPALRHELMILQGASDNEIHREALAAKGLAETYATCIASLLQDAGMATEAIRAVGVHGQTIRHRPELGYTRQTNNPALLAELCGIDVVADFRSRDVAAGGQGAPLVPAFHAGVFGVAGELRVVANIGGIGNISVLAPTEAGTVTGFDTGPGNVLIDSWILQQRGLPYDAGGAWAACGVVHAPLLTAMLSDPFLAKAPPKSTGRDLFHRGWLAAMLAPFSGLAPEDVQASLTAFTAITLADAIASHADGAKTVVVCGGGAYNTHLLDRLQNALKQRQQLAQVITSDALGISPNHVEALAFAWLAHRFTERLPGNLPAVTGAQGLRILGALYPA